jgi:uncharacterized protein with PQ loop repeat
MNFSSTEIIGYLASLIVLISFLMKDIKKLRIINSVGCVLFVAYGILLNFSMPIILTNTAIAGINIYYLVRANKQV